MSFWSRIRLLYRNKKELKKRNRSALNRSEFNQGHPRSSPQKSHSYEKALHLSGLVTLDFETIRPPCRSSSIMGTIEQGKTWAVEHGSSSSGFGSLHDVQHVSSRCHFYGPQSEAFQLNYEERFRSVYENSFSSEETDSTYSHFQVASAKSQFATPKSYLRASKSQIAATRSEIASAMSYVASSKSQVATSTSQVAASKSYVSASKSCNSLVNNVGSSTSLNTSSIGSQCDSFLDDSDSDDVSDFIPRHHGNRRVSLPSRRSEERAAAKRNLQGPMSARRRRSSRLRDGSNSTTSMTGRHPESRSSFLGKQQTSDGTWIWFPGPAAVSSCSYGCVTAVTLGQQPAPQVTSVPSRPRSDTVQFSTRPSRRRSMCEATRRSYPYERPPTVGPAVHHFV